MSGPGCQFEVCHSIKLYILTTGMLQVNRMNLGKEYIKIIQNDI